MHQNTTNFKMSQTEIQTLTKGLELLQEQFTEFSSTQDRLVILIAGNQELDKKDRGLLGRFEKVEQTQEKYIKYYWMFLGGAFVVGFILSYIF